MTAWQEAADRVDHWRDDLHELLAEMRRGELPPLTDDEFDELVAEADAAWRATQ